MAGFEDASADARAWAKALRQAEFSYYSSLNWWQRKALWLVLRSTRLKAVLQAGFEADVLLQFASNLDRAPTLRDLETKGKP